ncbi:AmmeMemoRadiSam system radical SAM enzyme [Ruminococcaceae bacterium OttesenSCG-928-L11]|nr:AmmeMemoRadiSam system radical SAM enzyme [Ruminococcaceae bacterium OttesenSCG-928-L11]
MLEGKRVQCRLCPHSCIIEDGKTGFCLARMNLGGKLFSVNYGKVTSMGIDPIEKKPLRRFMRGSKIVSVGSYGCNLRCPYCQNHTISMGKPKSRSTNPEELSRFSLSQVKMSWNVGVAYTYNEPLVGFEYVLDCAKLIRRQNQHNVLVTNGYINEEPLAELLPYIDAMNIDLKGIRDDSYDWLGGKTEVVKRTIRQAAKQCHVEVTTLIVPGHNDSTEEILELSKWLASVDAEIPLHISRYFPRYQLDTPAPPEDTIHHLVELAKLNLAHVYAGNC